MLTAAALFGLGVWLLLIFGWWGFWRADQRLPDRIAPQAPTDQKGWPSVAAIVPARDEAATVGASIAALLGQDYPGRLSVTLVDDASTDGTTEVAKAAAARFHDDAAGTYAPTGQDDMNDKRIMIFFSAAPPLRPGWSGKLSALQAGISGVEADRPDFFWFTDADVVHEPHVLARLVAKAEDDPRDLVSLMVRLHCESRWERLLVPAFVFFFQMLYPFRAVNDRATPTVAAAAGGCVLVRASALARVGGISAIKAELIDDVALAAAVKGAGFDIWLGLGDESRSLRAAGGLGDLWRMVARTAYTQLRHSVFLLIGTVWAMVATFLVPPLVALTLPLHGAWLPALLGAAAWAAMAVAYAPTLRYYRRPALEGLALPLAAALYTAMTVGSAVESWRGRAGRWKGRTYPHPDTKP